MKNNSNLIILLLIVGAFAPFTAKALTATSSGAVSNKFLFISNKVDGEYFVTPQTVDPRFSGANVWVKFGASQVSLGYMGFVGWTAPVGNYQDMWIDNSPIDGPFRGIRCFKGTNCPQSGYIAGLGTDANGFYHAQSYGGVVGGAYGFASFTDSAYRYFENMPTGSSETLVFNRCYTSVNYNYSAGERCKDQSSGKWQYVNYTITKQGNLSLESTDQFQDIWIGSDGTPSFPNNGGPCELGIVSGEEGVICKMVTYNLQETSNLTVLKFRAHADSAALGFTPAEATLRYSGDGVTWYNYSYSTPYQNVFSNGENHIYLFYSKTFLKRLIDLGVTLNEQPITFGFDNIVATEAGHYQFTPSLKINIIPREYSISIVSADNSLYPSGSGTIGEESPIGIDYIVTVSGAHQADSITAQVVGDSTTISDTPYCLFTSARGPVSVPIPAVLQYNNQSGSLTKVSNSCSEEAISLNDALWRETPWDENNTDAGSFFSTNLSLLFPMNDSRSALTVSGTDWEGVVSASGVIKVTANWVGVTK
ncbi:fimbrial protein [Hafnia paralvei]|uniref:fimbrial protein n=1 Tax=Hafnia paralvei TaxID=546367 RepID=UPI0020001A61|nr:fimbrial protein [Hafnia paralvei]MCK2181978.1 fimbrial protein [Hafnia paralvei]